MPNEDFTEVLALLRPHYDGLRSDFPELPSELGDVLMEIADFAYKRPNLELNDILSLWCLSWLKQHLPELLERRKPTGPPTTRGWRQTRNDVKEFLDNFWNQEGE